MEEARDRNYALVQMYGSIPSYAIFSADDIEKESEAARLAWWMDIETTDPTILSLVIKYTGPYIILDIILNTMRNEGLDKACEIVIKYKTVLAKASMFDRTIPIDSFVL